MLIRGAIMVIFTTNMAI